MHFNSNQMHYFLELINKILIFYRMKCILIQTKCIIYLELINKILIFYRMKCIFSIIIYIFECLHWDKINKKVKIV